MAASPISPLTTVAGSGVLLGGGESGGTVIGGGDDGGTTITGGGEDGGLTTNGGGETGGVVTTGGPFEGGTTATGGLTGQIGGKNAEAEGDQLTNGADVSVIVTTGSNFASFFFKRLRRAMTVLLRRLSSVTRFTRLVWISSACSFMSLEHFAPYTPLPPTGWFCRKYRVAWEVREKPGIWSME